MTLATTGGSTADDGTYLVTGNGHGDTIGLAEIDGTTGVLTPAARVTYSTWGTPTVSAVNGYGDLGFRYLYVARFDVQWDDFSGAGLLSMHARHYSPEFGRFLQPDPSALEANLYGYAENSPVTKIDPSGTIPCLIPIVGWSLCAIAVQAIITAVVWAPRVAPALSAIGITSVKIGPRFTLSLSRLQHVLTNHSGNLSRAALRTRDAARWAPPGSRAVENVTKWLSNWNIPRAMQQTLAKPTQVRFEGNTIVYARRFPTAAGVDGYGNLQYWVRVVTDMRGNIITAYPANRAFKPYG